MPTVADVVSQAIARERARCASVVRDMRDVCLGRGDLEGAGMLGTVLSEIDASVQATVVSSAESTPASSHVVDDDDGDFDAVSRQVSARMFGYGRD